MGYICVKKKQRGNVTHIALFIRESGVGTERILLSVIKRRDDKELKKRTVYFKKNYSQAQTCIKTLT